MILLFDIGNTHTHLGLGDTELVHRQGELKTSSWFDGTAARQITRFLGGRKPEAAVLCSVVPRATAPATQAALALGARSLIELTPRTLRGVGIDYPRPKTIGPDRLANAVAAVAHFGAPSIVVDFGTAVTFDVIDARSNYVGGIITPGLAAMTEYLHEKTALLPRIRIREINTVIGRSTRNAMLIGAVHGYRGLIRELLLALRRELKVKSLPVIATGGYAKLMAKRLPEITAVDPKLTLEGLRLTWFAHHPAP